MGRLHLNLTYWIVSSVNMQKIGLGVDYTTVLLPDTCSRRGGANVI